MKIQIIGYSGSGKSTIAKTLGELYDIPVIHLDNIKFYGNWQERTDEEQTEVLQDFLNKNKSWVIDGNYSKICPQRFEESDMTIFLNFNRFVCFWSAYKRYKQHRLSPRESCPCNDKFDHKFKKWLLLDGRTRKRQKKHIFNLNKTSGEKVILKNRKQVDKFVEILKQKIKENKK